jgi:type I restriction enzyme S subunit
MRELLTGRIRVREDGKPVFYRETEFQETEIGKIPSEWKIVKLKDIAVEIKSGFASGKRDEADGIIHLRMFNIGLDGMLSFDEVIKVPKPKDWRRYLLRYGDILLVNTSGSEEHIGKVAFFEDVELECTYSNHLTRIRVVENGVDSRWVYFVLHYLWQIGYFKSLVHQQAGGQRNIPLKAIENLPIILPPINEARKIAEFLSIINTVIKLCREEKVKLDHLKRGLMNLLLTGKVRVVE